MKKLDDDGIHLNIQLIYAPMTPTTIKIMEIIKDRYTTTIPNPLLFEDENEEIVLPSYFQANMSVNGFKTEDDMVEYAKASFMNQCGNPLLGKC
ncbi:hypothetical protein COOONC_09391 [Cooperia oncophora]